MAHQKYISVLILSLGLLLLVSLGFGEHSPATATLVTTQGAQ